MVGAVIPCRRGDHINEVVSRLNEQNVLTVVVRDNCDVKVEGATQVIDVKSGGCFNAGFCRDVGIDYYLGVSDTKVDGLIFVDEDCLPQETLVEDHMHAISRKMPVISIGRRLEAKHGWKDPRELGDAGKFHVFDGEGSVIQNVTWVHNCLATWTCNLAINWPAVHLIRRAMKKFSGHERLFHPAFDGHWGGEDAFLAYIAWTYRVPMAFLPYRANAVKHMDHPRPMPEYGPGFKERLDVQVTKLRDYLSHGHPVTLDDITY